MLIVFIAIAAITAIIINKIKPVAPVTPPVVTTPQARELCFYYEKPTSRGFADIAWLKMNITGGQVSGEFRNLPAETDSKVGTFTGTVGAVDQGAMARTADVWWDSLAEGMQVREQLKIIFGEGTAQAAFGEMMDRGDGVYVYKDPNKYTLGFPMTDVACSDLDDRIIVEKYIRENIRTLAPEQPVLGGTWYAMNIHIDPTTHTGTMGYEDGHITGKARFSYTRVGDQVTLSSIEKMK